jgi:hypothetical protein
MSAAGVLNEGLIKPGGPFVVGGIEIRVVCVGGGVNRDRAERALQRARRRFQVLLRVFAQGQGKEAPESP